MKTSLGLVLASSLMIAAGACAGGGGSSGGGGVSPTPSPTGGGEELALGENPRRNEFTSTAEDQLDQAYAAEEEGNEQVAQTSYQAAAEAAKQAIDADVTNPLPWFQGGQAQIGLGNYEVADSMLERAEELRPIYGLDITPIRELAWIELYNEAAPLVDAGDYDAAGEVFAKAHAIYQGRPEVMFTLGQIRAQQGRYEEAIEILTQAREVAASDEARELFDSTAIAGWDEQAEAVRPVIAQSLLDDGRMQEGAQMLRELVADYPENMAYRRNLATVYGDMEMPDSAAAIYSDLLTSGQLGSDELYAIGAGFYNLEQNDKAAEAFKQAVERSPYDRDAAEMWARSLVLAHPAGEGAPAAPPAVLTELREAAQKWAELDPYSRQAFTLLAQAERRLGNEEAMSQIIDSFNPDGVVDNLTLRRRMGGGASVTGNVMNLQGEPGTPVTIEVTFYGESGSPIGSDTATLLLPAVDASQNFEATLEAEQMVMGYTYTAQGLGLGG